MSQVHSTPMRRPVWMRLTVAAAVALPGFALVVSWTRDRRPVHRPAVTSPATPRAAAQRCADCHSEITESFASAPHSHTLQRATDSDVAAVFAGREFYRADSGVVYRYHQQDGRLMVSTPAYARDLPIEWVFGSGTHARTPVITWTDNHGDSSAIEHSVSWYPSDRLGVTLGMEKLDDSSSFYALGRHWGAAETINCFGCHSTFVPTVGEQIDFDRIEPGIGCTRCHWNTSAHVREMDAGADATIERLSDLTPEQAVDRCGECHRRASEMGGPITRENTSIVRFAPVGLVQSACFLRQSEVRLESGAGARLDCMTCHNPHQPSARNARLHIAVCLNCHNASLHRAAECPVASRNDDCLSCHMPPVAMNENMKFTDHWIRVRQLAPVND